MENVQKLERGEILLPQGEPDTAKDAVPEPIPTKSALLTVVEEESRPVRKRRKQERRWKAVALGLVLPALLLGVWELTTRLHLVKPFFLPRPWTVALAFKDMI